MSNFFSLKIKYESQNYECIVYRYTNFKLSWIVINFVRVNYAFFKETIMLYMIVRPRSYEDEFNYFSQFHTRSLYNME